MVKLNITTDMSAETAHRVFDWGLAVGDTVLVVGDRKLRLGDLTPAGVHYLAAYGMRESLRDSVSGVEKAIKVAAEAAIRKDKPDTAAWTKFAKEAELETGTLPADIEMVEYVTDAVVTKRQSARFDAILASSIPVKDSAGRLSGKDAFAKKTALAMIKAVCDRTGKSLPTGDKLAEILPKYLAAKSAEIEAAWVAHNALINGAADAADDLIG